MSLNPRSSSAPPITGQCLWGLQEPSRCCRGGGRGLPVSVGFFSHRASQSSSQVAGLRPWGGTCMGNTARARQDPGILEYAPGPGPPRPQPLHLQDGDAAPQPVASWDATEGSGPSRWAASAHHAPGPQHTQSPTPTVGLPHRLPPDKPDSASRPSPGETPPAPRGRPAARGSCGTEPSRPDSSAGEMLLSRRDWLQTQPRSRSEAVGARGQGVGAECFSRRRGLRGTRGAGS